MSATAPVKPKSVNDIKLTKSQGIMLNILKTHAGSKTIQELAKEYDKATNKKHKVDSLKTMISQIGTAFEEMGGVKFPAKWKPKGSGQGRGRQAQRVSVTDALNGLNLSEVEFETVDVIGEDESDDSDSDSDSDENAE